MPGLSLFGRRENPSLTDSVFLSMEDARVAPLLVPPSCSSSSSEPPSASTFDAAARPKPVSLRKHLGRILFGRHGGASETTQGIHREFGQPAISSTAVPTSSARTPTTSLRKHFARILLRRGSSPAAAASASGDGRDAAWHAERLALLTERDKARAAAEQLERSLSGWAGLAQDVIFYGIFHGRREGWTEKLADHLRQSLSEVEGVVDLEVGELRLPTGAEFAPQLTLHKYVGPELSEWLLRWEPPSAQAGASITLKGRKFGVSFTVAVAIDELRLSGLLVCHWTPQESRPKLILGFKKMPSLLFEVNIAGKALSLGSETLRAWLQRQVGKLLRERVVLPQTLELELPFHRGGSDEDDAADAAAEAAALAEDEALGSLLGLRTDSAAGPTWELDERLASQLHVPLGSLEQRRPMLEGNPFPVEPDEWATSLVIAVLQLRFHDRLPMWSELVETRRQQLPHEVLRAGLQTVCDLVEIVS